MKQYKITYFLEPDAENVVINIFAKTYEDACIFAKEYRREGFSCEEI